MFRAAVRSLFQRVLPTLRAMQQPAVPAVIVNLPSTPVVKEDQPAPVNQTRSKRFRRTLQEIRLGLSIEEAMASRGTSRLMDEVRPTKVTKPVENKAKRFRRTAAEIEAGLTIEQAAAARGAALPSKPKKIYVERKVEAKPLPTTDLITTLSPRIQRRANVMTTMRRRGQQGVITTEMLDLVADAVAAGKVTKCAPFVDSDGYNHFTGQEAQ